VKKGSFVTIFWSARYLFNFSADYLFTHCLPIGILQSPESVRIISEISVGDMVATTVVGMDGQKPQRKVSS